MNEVFGSVKNETFAGMSVISVGDFFHLLSVEGIADDWKNFKSLWKRFKILELNEFMRQPGDPLIVDLLNNVRTADVNQCYMDLLESRVK